MPNLAADNYYSFTKSTTQYCSCLNGASVCSLTSINTGVTVSQSSKTTSISASDLSLVSKFNLATLNPAV